MQRVTREYIVTSKTMVLRRIDMPEYDILCRAPNRNILSCHTPPQNIANVIFVNLLLQKCDGTCFAVTATHKFTSRPLASRQGMSSSHWGSRTQGYSLRQCTHSRNAECHQGVHHLCCHTGMSYLPLWIFPHWVKLDPLCLVFCIGILSDRSCHQLGAVLHEYHRAFGRSWWKGRSGTAYDMVE